LEEKPEKYDIIDNIDKICLFLRTKKRNIEKVCFEEGKNLLLENLDITNLFVSSLIVGKNLDKLSINKDIPISEKNRKYFSSIEDKINALKTSSESGVIK
jgi:predicted ATP-grasp superfamily ATP-dependent carboligase